MKKVFSIWPVVLCLVLAFVWVGTEGVAAMEPSAADGVRLSADDPVTDAEFGRSVAIDGNLVAVGAGAANAGDVEKAGAVYLFKRQGKTYVEEAKLVAPDPSTGAEFGRAVAIEGNRVIVGARFAAVGNFTEAGAAYVFRKSGGAWNFEEKIVSPTPADDDNFARALAVQGNLLVITARKEKLDANDVGAAYVYLYRNGNWTCTEKLTAGDPAPGAYFGQSVAVRGDLMAIGARNAEPAAAGAVYLFQHIGKGWVEIAKVIPPDGAEDDQFGFTVAMVGNVMTVGARRADPMEPALKDAGAAYVYALDLDSISLAAKLTAGDAIAGDQFGQAVAMAGDVIAVGANRAAIGANTRQGAVYLFRRMGNSWLETDKITASEGKKNDEFGYSLAAFGNVMITGAHFADQTGAAYVIPLKP